MSIKLSILICSLEKRKHSLQNLLDTLDRQKTDDVEIIIDVDNGAVTVGEKRQRLLEKATGDYVAYIDDDDMVEDDYVELILEALKDNPDCCSIRGLWMIRKKKTNYKIIWGKDYNWKKSGDTYYIGTNHITPVKREIALKAGFTKRDRGEDLIYGDKVRKFIETENKIDKLLYYYICDIDHTDTKRVRISNGTK
jgi:glycosyltransferase involved in cell wall biosynthesis